MHYTWTIKPGTCDGKICCTFFDRNGKKALGPLWVPTGDRPLIESMFFEMGLSIDYVDRLKDTLDNLREV